jgi:hypothetical protein
MTLQHIISRHANGYLIHEVNELSEDDPAISLVDLPIIEALRLL